MPSSRHLDIEHDDIGPGMVEPLDCLAAVAQRRTSLRRRLVDPARQQVPHDSGVVDHHDADFIRRGKRPECRGTAEAMTLIHHFTYQHSPNLTPRRADQISNLWNFASTISLSNGFMMYSLAPAWRRARDMRDVVLGSAEHHLGPVAAGKPTQRFEELVAVHLRHVPIEQDRVRQTAMACAERLLAILGFRDREFHALQNAGATSDGRLSHPPPNSFSSCPTPFELLMPQPFRHAATALFRMSSTQSTSSTTMSWPSSR